MFLFKHLETHLNSSKTGLYSVRYVWCLQSELKQLFCNGTVRHVYTVQSELKQLICYLRKSKVDGLFYFNNVFKYSKVNLIFLSL